MADYTGVTDAKHATLGVSTADSVTFDSDVGQVSLAHRGDAGMVFYTAGDDGVNGDPATPTVEGDDCYLLMPGERLIVDPRANGNTRIRLISDTAVAYSVERA